MVSDDLFGAVASLKGLREQLGSGAPSPLQAYAQALSSHFGELSSPSARIANNNAGWMAKANLSPAETWLAMRESKGDPTAQNKTSTAKGWWQGLLKTRKAYMGANYDSTDPMVQLPAFRRYVEDRYGTAEKAVAFHKVHGYY